MRLQDIAAKLLFFLCSVDVRLWKRSRDSSAKSWPGSTTLQCVESQLPHSIIRMVTLGEQTVDTIDRLRFGGWAYLQHVVIVFS